MCGLWVMSDAWLPDSPLHECRSKRVRRSWAPNVEPISAESTRSMVRADPALSTYLPSTASKVGKLSLNQPQRPTLIIRLEYVPIRSSKAKVEPLFVWNLEHEPQGSCLRWSQRPEGNAPIGFDVREAANGADTDI